MDGLHIFLAVLMGVVSCSHDWISTSALDLTASQGDNITLYCDCKLSTGVYIAWYRNCSHENQPTLVLKTKIDDNPGQQNAYSLNPLPRFTFLRNFSSESYDLRIINVTDSDEGLYYCGTEQAKVEENEFISQININTYGNITRLKLKSQQRIPKDDCDNKVCWILLSSLCPASAVLSSLLSVFIYHLCHKKGNDLQTDESRPSKREQTRRSQDEDVCYAALEIRQASQRPKKKKESSDFSTYSAINTCSM
ncbi:uncharacterized protein LOC114440732 isoform X2 [Parambassis ranga]|uniref:Uncharacterized protein LOC114440732 isoform X2 n=1 Tax=Parambassis ranga TaxID=210632 RepID=A0A6P7IU39_9TELE|nr:uncharacterized protein LOC114440732 isoform X2 [Parambassis ranga]